MRIVFPSRESRYSLRYCLLITVQINLQFYLRAPRPIFQQMITHKMLVLMVDCAEEYMFGDR